MRMRRNDLCAAETRLTTPTLSNVTATEAATLLASDDPAFTGAQIGDLVHVLGPMITVMNA
jgi:hypothetical protein